MAKSSQPFWLTTPCPAWCWGNHKKSDDGTDRHHVSRWSKRVTLTTMDEIRTDLTHFNGKVYHSAPAVEAYMIQGYRETGPRVIVEDANGRFTLDLTLDETQKLAAALLKAVRLAKGAA